MSLCLYGGTFDPPHIAHAIIAESLLDQFGLDKILFLPAYLAPHKSSQDCSAIQHRVAMVRLAIAGNPRFELSTLEADREGISYTIDTINAINRVYHLSREDFYFLIGSDSLMELHRWRQPQEILRRVTLLVAPRPGFDPGRVQPEFLAEVQFIQSPVIEISSSRIREKLRCGESIRYLVNPAVEAYICEHQLYRTEAQ